MQNCPAGFPLARRRFLSRHSHSRGFPILSRSTLFHFFLMVALALAAFLRLLRIMTTLRKEPTTAQPSRIRMTGIRMAQARGGKKACSGWSESTKGWAAVRWISFSEGRGVLLPWPASRWSSTGTRRRRPRAWRDRRVCQAVVWGLRGRARRG